MFDPEVELSSDLEWMLQSGQASQAMLAEALIDEYYPQVYQLAFSLFEDPAAAYAAALETFVAALLSTYRVQNGRYRSRAEIDIWFWTRAGQVIRAQWQAAQSKLPAGQPGRQTVSAQPAAGGLEARLQVVLDGLDPVSRLVLGLHVVQGRPAGEVSRILRLGEKAVQERLLLAHSRLQIALDAAGLPGHRLPMGSLEAYLPHFLQARWPQAESLPDDFDRLVAEVTRRCALRSARRKRFTYLKELLLVALAALVVIGAALSADRLLPAGEPAETEAQGEAALPDIPDRSLPETGWDGQQIYFVQSGDTLAGIAERFGISVENLAENNNLHEDDALHVGRPLFFRMDPPPKSRAAPTATPRPPRFALSDDQPEALTLYSSSHMILDRLQHSSQLWQTAWIDAQLINYGPAGYIGQPEGYRVQAWIDASGRSLEIWGPLGAEPRVVSMVRGEERFHYYLKYNYLSRSTTNQLLSWSDLDKLLFPHQSDFVHPQGSFDIIEETGFAGRRVVVVDWAPNSARRTARLWLDAYTGVILRQQNLSQVEPQVVVSEYVITTIVYDASFSPEVYELSSLVKTRFLDGPAGQPVPYEEPLTPFERPAERQPLDHLLPPEGFNPARSRLTFQYRRPVNQVDSWHLPIDISADLFAGRFYLGRVHFSNPWNTLCSRSPDGMRLAFINRTGLQRLNAPLRWFSLDDPGDLRSAQIGIFPSRLVFAPDSRLLAAYDDTNLKGVLYLVDTDTGAVRLLLEIEPLASLTWSPDGAYLVLVTDASEENPQPEVLVVGVERGEVVYRGLTGADSPEWPLPGLEPTLSEGPEGLEQCIRPPGE